MADRLSHYILAEKIGTGGMGTVYRAQDVTTGDTVAIKMLHAHLSADPEYVRRFEREAQIAQSVQSPNVVRVLDSGHDGKTYFIVLEYVEGQSLAQYINQRGRLPIPEVVSLTSAIARGLAATNAQGIVHRDVSPQNVMVAVSGNAKLTDFGISRDLGQTVITATSTVMGKPIYIAPELFTGSSRADIRSDIYALGIVTFQLLAGELPFNADTPYALMQKHVHEPMPPLHPDVPPWLAAIVSQCLAKDPGTRFQTPEALLAALEAGGDGFIEATIALPVATEVVQLPPSAQRPTDIEVEVHELSRGKAGQPSEYRLTLRNPDPRSISLKLDAEETSRGLDFNLPASWTIGAQAEDQIPFNVRTIHRRWFAGTKRWPFTVRLVAADDSNIGSVATTGYFEEIATMGPILLTSGIAIAIGALTVGALWATYSGKSDKVVSSPAATPGASLGAAPALVTPTVTATLLPELRVTQASFSETLDASGAPVKPATVFAFGIKQVNAFILLEGVTAGTTLTAHWYQLNVRNAPPGGKEVNSTDATIQASDIEGGKAIVRFSERSNNGLPKDSWELRVYQGDKLIMTRGFNIQ